MLFLTKTQTHFYLFLTIQFRFYYSLKISKNTNINVLLKVCANNNSSKRELFTVIVVFKTIDENKTTQIAEKIQRKNLLWVSQEELPVFDSTGKIMLQDKTKLMLESNGLGGVFRSIIAPNFYHKMSF